MKFTSLAENDRDDHAVDAEDTCHDNWNQRFHDDSGSPDGYAADACACLGCTVGCAEV
jgi:hypothetical protein